MYEQRVIDRFWEKVDRSGGPDACWEWQASKTKSGYGMFTPKHSHKTVASRFSWELANGPIPHGMHICHKCDNPSCVNPSHLFVGTPFDNQHDRIAKGRPNGAELRRGISQNAGETNPSSKLSWSQVMILRDAFSAFVREWAEQYGVSGTTVIYACLRKTWRQASSDG